MMPSVPPFVRNLPVIRDLPLLGGDEPPIVLEIDLTRGLLSAAPADPLSALRSHNTPVLREVLTGLRIGAEDDRVAGLVLRVTDAISATHAEELGAAIAAFGAAGKTTVAWTPSFGELGPGTLPYYLASFTESIWLQPSGAVGLTGIALSMTTVRGTLDKIGAEPQLGQRHEYKSAAERMSSREISAPNREMTTRIADSVMGQVTAAASRRGEVAPESVAAAVAESPVTATRALELGLVDRLGFRDDVYAWVRESLGRDGEIELTYAHRYAKRQMSKPAEQLRRRKQPKVAVVEVAGGISVGRSGGGPFGGPSSGSDSICAALRAAREDDDVEAVVLRVDSPGGSYVASDAIRAAVLGVRETGRPVIASMATYAASGGFFVAMPCDHIVALPSTLTGSIGVLGGKMVFAETLERLGVTRETVGAGDHAAMFETSAGFDTDEWAKVDGWLDLVYADFTEKAALDRGLPLDELEPIARGRVWTGADAAERSLVDELGGLSAAIDEACRRIERKRSEVNVVALPHVSPWQRLMSSESSESLADARLGGPPAGLADTVIGRLTASLGLPPDGVLTMPWSLRLG